MIITGDDLVGIQELKKFLNRQFEMKDLRPLSYFLGLEITTSTDGYYLTQAKYISDLISKSGLTDSKIVDTPLVCNTRLNLHDRESLRDGILYRQLVGSLVYLTVTCPDVSYAVHIVNWAGDPTDRHSTTGYCFFLSDSLISWRSKKQTVVVRYSTEAEYRAFADTTSELL
ncbi:uncharacterized mitochondrial protein AtMg00810-like [Cornus florida]|uniref:uncharacterized mitochondrial protein AtMg00810-like n=1 Tax=Cornus florida TaxID=4283 RepID=UPI00289DFC90|nr:uncharacterized mitochondrial protein AtMg00810-like [Cornus florida]